MDRQTTLHLHPPTEAGISPFAAGPDRGKLIELVDADKAEMLEFLRVRPVHTVVMTSFINDNGVESELNRGRFYGYRNSTGELEGIALIGHSTLVEARTGASLMALADQARTSETPIHLVMSSGTDASAFWQHMTGGLTKPRLTCVESLFEAALPFAVRKPDMRLRNADMSNLIAVAEAQAEVAFIECGVDPMIKDRDGFLKRVARRIEQNRVFVVTAGDQLIFKADIIAETDDVIYLEGIYVHPDHRGNGVGSQYLALLTEHLLDRVDNICLLSNIEFRSAHRTFEKAGYRHTDNCVSLFV
ncbi:MAG: GNAT family N-acetyltransferase [Chloracidobacterium sp.]|nr:GNAT family N-acetyltransferase [Chloracidobacterium sp.]